MRNIVLIVSLLGVCLSGISQPTIQAFSDARLYFSGEQVNLILAVAGASEDKVTSEVLLIDASGEVVNRMHFMLGTHSKSAVFTLPKELATGNYRLLASFPESLNYSEILIHVYDPSDTELEFNNEPVGGKETWNTEKLSGQTFEVNSQAVYSIPDAFKKDAALAIVKVFESTDTSLPGIGRSRTRQTPGDQKNHFVIEPLSTHPNSRLSVYFVDQQIVEEHYYSDLEWFDTRMHRHFGTSRICAFQFDERGDFIGPVGIRIEAPETARFETISTNVPFNKEINQYLNEKRKRKFVAQVYNIQHTEIFHYAEENPTIADLTIEVNQYEDIATVGEAIDNVVPRAHVIRKNKENEIRLAPMNSGFRYDNAPLVLLNGIPVLNLDSLLEMPVSAVKSISVYNSNETIREFGTPGRYGVLAITLNEKVEMPEINAPEMVTFHGINDEEIRHLNVEENPDLRTDLFWGYQVLSDSNSGSIEWLNSSVTGNYILWMCFVTPEGVFVQKQVPVTISPEAR